MRNKSIFLSAVVVAFLGIALMSGCKKDETVACSNGLMSEGETGVDCGGPCKPCTARQHRVKTHTISFGTIYTTTEEYTYDSKGRVSTVKVSNSLLGVETHVYTYSTGSFYKQLPDNFNEKHTFNSNGFVATMKLDSIDSTFANDSYYYDSLGHLTSTQSGQTFYWDYNTGNLISANGFGTNKSYNYKPDTENTIGNENFGRTYMGVSSPQLANSVYVQTPDTTFSFVYQYKYDSKNRVAEFVNENFTETYTYY